MQISCTTRWTAIWLGIPCGNLCPFTVTTGNASVQIHKSAATTHFHDIFTPSPDKSVKQKCHSDYNELIDFLYRNASKTIYDDFQFPNSRNAKRSMTEVFWPKTAAAANTNFCISNGGVYNNNSNNNNTEAQQRGQQRDMTKGAREPRKRNPSAAECFDSLCFVCHQNQVVKKQNNNSRIQMKCAKE